MLMPVLAAPLHAQASPPDDRQSVVHLIEEMFGALARGDTAAMRAAFLPEGRVVQTGIRNGIPAARVNSLDEFLHSIGTAAPHKLEEKIFSPSVQIEDNLAVVWARYEFLVDGKSSHCGVDSYQAVRTPEGWKLLHIVDTQKLCDK
jgi:hypothetical protein